MNPIYAQHEKAFANDLDFSTSIQVEDITDRVSIKYGARVTAFVHFHGTVMRKGIAGGGYDRTTAAVLAAAKSIDAICPHTKKPMGDAAAFVAIAANAQDGLDWVTVFEKAGYTILRAL